MGAVINKDDRKKLVQDLTDIIIRGDRYDKSEIEWAKHFSVTRTTIRKLFDEAYKLVPEEDIKDVAKQFRDKFKTLEKKTLELLHDPIVNLDPEQKRRNIDMTMKVMKEQTDFLERFHLKAKAQENISIQVEKQLVLGLDERVIDIEESDGTV